MSRLPDPASEQVARRLGRYELFERIASGGMAAVYFGRALGSGGFERIVAIKMCHEHLRDNDEFVKMFLDEARLAAKIHHPNVVPTLDASDVDGLYLVMDFVEGGPLLSVIRAALQHGEPVPASIAIRIMSDTLAGLHAAHELTDAAGSPYNIVHRDVSPPNILVGLDGITRIADFGVAKAAARAAETRDGQLKGKIPYMAPEQFEGIAMRQTDVFSAGVVLWETLVGKRLFNGKTDVETMRNVLMSTPAAPSSMWSGVPAALDPIVLRALHKDPEERYPTAAAFADALEGSGVPVATTRAVTAYLTKMLGSEIETRRGHYRQFMKADVVLATPAPSSGVTQRKMSEALADFQSSPGSNPAVVQPAPSAPASEKSPLPRPGALRAATKPPLPTAAAPTEKPATPSAKPAIATPSLNAPAPTVSRSFSPPAVASPASPAKIGAVAKPASSTALKSPTAPVTTSPTRAAKSTMIGFAPPPTAAKPSSTAPVVAPAAAATLAAEKSDAAFPSATVAAPVANEAPAPMLAAIAAAPSAVATLASSKPDDIAPIVTAAIVPSVTPVERIAAPFIASEVPSAAPMDTATVTGPERASPSAADDERIILPTHGSGRREWIAGGFVLAVLAAIAVVIGFRSGSRDAHHAPPVAVSDRPAHADPPVVIPVAPAAAIPTPTVAAPEPTPAVAENIATPTVPLQAPLPTPTNTPPVSPAPAVAAPAIMPPAAHPVVARTNPAAATTSATPTRPPHDVRGGLRPRPTTGHGYVPDDI